MQTLTMMKPLWLVSFWHRYKPFSHNPASYPYSNWEKAEMAEDRYRGRSHTLARRARTGKRGLIKRTKVANLSTDVLECLECGRVWP